jgi:hypothetical protein
LISVFVQPPEELTTTELVRVLKAHSQIEPGLVDAIGAFLRQCDELKFAPVLPPPQPGLVARALELVEAAEKQRSRPMPGAPTTPATGVPSPTAA